MKLTNLHTKTAFGSVGSIIKDNSLYELKNPVLSVIDDNMFNIINFYSGCVANGIKPVIGLDANLAFGDMASNIQKYNQPSGDLSLIALDNRGYNNLIKLSTISYVDGMFIKPRIDLNILDKCSDGLLCLINSNSSNIAYHLRAGAMAPAIQDIKNLKEIFSDRLRFEIISNMDFQPEIFNISTSFKVKCIASNIAMYMNADDFDIWCYVVAIAHNMKISEVKKMYENKFFYKNYNEIANSYGINEDMIYNLYELIDMIGEYNINKSDIQIPSMGMSNEEFVNLMFDNLHRMGLSTKQYIERLNYELEVIVGFGYVDYFMLVADLIKYTNDNLSGYLSAGRGSVGGCLVAYILGITRIDPVNPDGFDMDIPFDRFLNSGRKVMPDIDLDFQPKDRPKIIEYLIQKYGDSSCKNMMTTTTMQAKSALRDACRVSDNLNYEMESIIKSFPKDQHLSLAMVEDSDIYIQNQHNKTFVEMFSIAKKLEGLPKGYGVHASGIALYNGDMTGYVPFFKINDRIVTQYDQDQLDYLGIIKLDILGLNALQIMKDAIEYIYTNLPVDQKNVYSKPIDIIGTVNKNDNDVYKFLNSGMLAGVFQWDTHNYINVIKEVHPSNFKELVDLNTLGRSAALISGLTEKYINRKRGIEKIEPLHPILKGLMVQTYELPLYQEQIMQIFIALANYNYSEADDVRKAIGKKIPELLNSQKEKFILGCKSNDISSHDANEIWQIIEKFSKYTWNLGHAMAYTQICYETAYLAYYYPAEYYCACINNSQSAEDAGDFVSVMKKRDINIIPTDINTSDIGYFPVSSDVVKAGYSGLKYISTNTISSLFEIINKNKFVSVEDFNNRVPKKVVNRTALKSLFCAGAFNNLINNESDANILADKMNISVDDFQSIILDQYNLCGRVQQDISTQFSDGGNIKDLQYTNNIVVYAYLVKIKEIYTKQSKKMAFTKFEDYNGRFEVTWFPESWDKVSNLLRKGNLYKIILMYNNGIIGLFASDIKMETK